MYIYIHIYCSSSSSSSSNNNNRDTHSPFTFSTCKIAATTTNQQSNMRPSALLRTLSSRLPVRLLSSPAVAPLPSPTRFDQLLTPQLDALLVHLPGASAISGNIGYTTSLAFLVDALSASAAAQKIAIDCLPNLRCRPGPGTDDRSAIDDYLDDSAELLDACRDLSAALEAIRNYSQSLQVALHSLHGRFSPSMASLARALQVLDSSDQAVGEMSNNMKHGSIISRRLIQKLAGQSRSRPAAELGEILGGSCAIASTACQILAMSLSFKSKRVVFPTLPTTSTSTSSWFSSLHELQKRLEESIQMKKIRKYGGFLNMLTELRETVMAAQELRIQIKDQKKWNDQLGVTVEELKRRCEALEQGIRALDDKLDHLYSHLISLRMAFLGILSHSSS